jgi:hypothetical protein
MEKGGFIPPTLHRLEAVMEDPRGVTGSSMRDVM